MSDTSNLSRKSYEKKDDVVINSIYLYTPDTLIELDSGDFVKELIIYENMIDCFLHHYKLSHIFLHVNGSLFL